ncbi:hypothetical protein [Clostridium tyrobutyricum]|uniref:hypothetical protein n=1 Tax=Clostridium tyrobutyricum TaxID=1519 RepID=UPI000AF0DB9A|nr:hypothetical protein [Clostridium tyrobutyricum]
MTTAEDFPDYIIEELFNHAPGYEEWIAQPKGIFFGARPHQYLPGAKSSVCVVYD